MLIRQEWADAARRLEEERADRRRYRQLVAQEEVILDELRRHVGQTYTLTELANAYRDSERWARHAIEDRAPSQGWARDLSLVLGSAFHAYQRGAIDYAP